MKLHIALANDKTRALEFADKQLGLGTTERKKSVLMIDTFKLTLLSVL